MLMLDSNLRVVPSLRLPPPVSPTLELEILNKMELRALAKGQRETLDFEPLNMAIGGQLAHWDRFQQATSVFSFRGRGHEVNLEALVHQFPEKHWFFPRISQTYQMTFHRVTLQSQWETNRWGILEPAADNPEWEGPQNPPEMILVPALFVDVAGNRLGFGGGYYDRFFSSLPDATWRVCPIPERFILPQLAVDPWDIPMHALVSENEIRIC